MFALRPKPRFISYIKLVPPYAALKKNFNNIRQLGSMLQSRNIVPVLHEEFYNRRSLNLCLFSQVPPPWIRPFSIASKRFASSSSSTRWKSRQAKDPYTREAKVQGLKSRAAFKLLEVDQPFPKSLTRMLSPGLD